MKASAPLKTLLAHANVPAAEINLDAACLVLVDYQKEYVEGGLPLNESEAALNVALGMLNAFRAADAPVVHVVHHGRPGGALFNPEGPHVAIADALAPQAGEAVVVKGLPSAFSGTDLEARLRATGRRQMVVGGFMTHMCVESTARAAAELGFQVVVVSDACATRDLPRPGATEGRVPAATLHEAALAALSDRFATVLDGTTFFTAVAAMAATREVPA